jgi:hypothetical protein
MEAMGRSGEAHRECDRKRAKAADGSAVHGMPELDLRLRTKRESTSGLAASGATLPENFRKR